MADRAPAVVLRIDRQSDRRICEGRSYSWYRRDDGMPQISVYETDDCTGEPSSCVVLEPDEVCYVMAAQSRATVEKIFGRERPAPSAAMRTTR